MFEINMDEYLDEEVESLKQAFEIIIRVWAKSQSPLSPTSPTTSTSARFLGSHNPALMKRNLLASFTDVLLLPVTIVPRTVGAAVGAAFTTGGTAAAQGIAMLNPQRWAGTGGMSSESGYSKHLELRNDEDGEDGFVNGVQESDPSSLTRCQSFTPFNINLLDELHIQHHPKQPSTYPASQQLAQPQHLPHLSTPNHPRPNLRINSSSSSPSTLH
jgi:recyclin-1